MNGLDSGRIVDVRYCGNFRALHFELFDAEQSLFVGGHYASAVLYHLGHKQHIRALAIKFEPIGNILLANRRGNGQN